MAERFWSKVDKSGECWLWKASVNSDGYGHFKYNNVLFKAHVAAYILEYGKVPEGKEVCHNCPGGNDNPACVRPSHLWAGTHHENITDMAIKGHVHAAKLTKDNVREIRQLAKEGYLQREIGEMYGVTQTNIWAILSGKSWKHVA